MGRLDQRRRGPRRRDEGADAEAIAFFMGEIPRPRKFRFVNPENLWPGVRDIVLPRWIAAHPGTRPPWWWRVEAPEPRRRLGGVGEPIMEAYHRGMPVFWAEVGSPLNGDQQPVDNDHPPFFEGEATYLQRHGLLRPEELEAVERLGLLDVVDMPTGWEWADDDDNAQVEP